MRSSTVFLDLGGAIFILLGTLHALYTFLDIGRPRRLVPKDPAVSEAMANSQLRLSRGGTTMWRAWVGFNFSHSLGVILFGVVCICAGPALAFVAFPAWVLFFLVVIGLVYLRVSALYWFRTPTIGIAVATGFVFLAWLMYVSGGA